MIINYLIYGILFMLFIDILVHTWLSKKHPGIIEAYNTLGITERIIMIVLWPLCLFVFAKAFWDQYNEED